MKSVISLKRDNDIERVSTEVYDEWYVFYVPRHIKMVLKCKLGLRHRTRSCKCWQTDSISGEFRLNMIMARVLEFHASQWSNRLQRNIKKVSKVFCRVSRISLPATIPKELTFPEKSRNIALDTNFPLPKIAILELHFRQKLQGPTWQHYKGGGVVITNMDVAKKYFPK